MGLPGWNPSTLKLLEGPGGLLCEGCCELEWPSSIQCAFTNLFLCDFFNTNYTFSNLTKLAESGNYAWYGQTVSLYACSIKIERTGGAFDVICISFYSGAGGGIGHFKFTGRDTIPCTVNNEFDDSGDCFTDYLTYCYSSGTAICNYWGGTCEVTIN